ncbi:MAG TPA: hypothetical protein VF158_03065 [Longimicrobiales bacterium]
MSAIDAAERWLEARRPEPPPGLRDRMLEAVRAVGGPPRADGRDGAAAPERRPASVPEGVPSVAALLGEAALDRLRVVLAAPSGRDAALDLLAADALLTYACEAAAEAGPEALDATARVYGPPRFEALLRERP